MAKMEPTVAVLLRETRVTGEFRSALFDAANRAGMTPNEFVITAAGEKLLRSGAEFQGIFRSGDIADLIGGIR